MTPYEVPIFFSNLSTCFLAGVLKRDPKPISNKQCVIKLTLGKLHMKRFIFQFVLFRVLFFKHRLWYSVRDLFLIFYQSFLSAGNSPKELKRIHISLTVDDRCSRKFNFQAALSYFGNEAEPSDQEH